MTRYTARFTPEAWQRDSAVEVDPEGPQEWDCTAYARQHLAYLDGTAQARGEDPDGAMGVLDRDDVFRADPAAPQWVREWRGPFTIRVRRVSAPVLEPGDPGYEEQGFGCCDGEDPEDPESCRCGHRLHGDPRSPGQQLEDYNRQAAEDGREPFEGTAMEFLEELRELEEG